MGKSAWVTLATNDSYSLGALVVAYSLKRVNTVHDLAILITPGVSDAMRDKLTLVFDLVKVVDLLDSQDKTNLALLKRPELGITFTKLHCWNLTQYEKCVFLDADTLILQNSDELFEREELSAAPDVGWPDCFNSGVFVFQPNNETFLKLIQLAIEKGSYDGGDQGLLNLFFSDWSFKNIGRHLPFIYNTCSSALYSYLPAFKQFGKNVKILHFIGTSKPWLQTFDTKTKTVYASNELGHLSNYLQTWWNIFCDDVHPKLTTDMLSDGNTDEQLQHQQHDRHQQHNNPNQHNIEEYYFSIYDGNDKKFIENFYNNNCNKLRSAYNWSNNINLILLSLSSSSLLYKIKMKNYEDYYKLLICNNNNNDKFIFDDPWEKYYNDLKRNEEEICKRHEDQQLEYHDEHHFIENNNNSIMKNDINAEEIENEQQCHCLYLDNKNTNKININDNQIYNHPSSILSLSPPKSPTFHNNNNNPFINHTTRHDHTFNTNNNNNNPYRESSSMQQNPISLSISSSASLHSPINKSPTNHKFFKYSKKFNHIHNHKHFNHNNDDDNTQRQEKQLINNTNKLQITSNNNHNNNYINNNHNNNFNDNDKSKASGVGNSEAGIAGALASLRLGEERSSEQDAFESHMRRQCWESGNIDYMGRDSFDNIWRRIQQTIDTPAPEPQGPPVRARTPTPQPEEKPKVAPVATPKPVVEEPVVAAPVVADTPKPAPVVEVPKPAAPAPVVEAPKPVAAAPVAAAPKPAPVEETPAPKQVVAPVATPKPAVAAPVKPAPVAAAPVAATPKAAAPAPTKPVAPKPAAPKPTVTSPVTSAPAQPKLAAAVTSPVTAAPSKPVAPKSPTTPTAPVVAAPAPAAAPAAAAKKTTVKDGGKSRKTRD